MDNFLSAHLWLPYIKYKSRPESCEFQLNECSELPAERKCNWRGLWKHLNI
jgi:hypothetical protein